jgi:aspartyl-tRNA(Asn)/glutamyl-tRNA(Gln) amidotransferase subunit A
MITEDLAFASIGELGAELRRGDISPVELAEYFLERIDLYDDRLNAFIAVTADRALGSARAAEAALAGGVDLGPLQGVPLALKDLFDLAGLPTTGGSILLQDTVADTNATVVQRVLSAGAALLGKTHMVEFAFGGTGVNHHYGTPWNPWDADTQRLPGGSSSGSGVAVAAGLAPAALGTDTGGSVRIPASFCGLVGLKPTFGRVSNAGVLPLDTTLDSVGSLTHTVEDAALLFRCLSGADTQDPCTLGRPPLAATDDLDGDISGMRVCFPRRFFWDQVNRQVEAAVRESAQVFADLGVEVDDISLPMLDELTELRAGINLTAVEAYLRWRDELENSLDRFDPVVAPRMLAGRETLAVDFLRQQRAFSALRQRALRSLESVDCLITPTTPFAAPPLAKVDTEEDYFRVNTLCLRNTSAVNQLGLCAVSLPCGFTSEDLPVGLQLIGKPFDELRLLRLAHAFEQATQWTRQRPDMDAFV